MTLEHREFHGISKVSRKIVERRELENSNNFVRTIVRTVVSRYCNCPVYRVYHTCASNEPANCHRDTAGSLMSRGCGSLVNCRVEQPRKLDRITLSWRADAASRASRRPWFRVSLSNHEIRSCVNKWRSTAKIVAGSRTTLLRAGAFAVVAGFQSASLRM